MKLCKPVVLTSKGILVPFLREHFLASDPPHQVLATSFEFRRSEGVEGAWPGSHRREVPARRTRDCTGPERWHQPRSNHARFPAPARSDNGQESVGGIRAEPGYQSRG